MMAAVVVILWLAIAGFSQTFRGAINGTVTDQSGAVVANASVKATNVATEVTLSTTTTSDGVFAFQDLPLGAYNITVVASGFKSETVDKVMVAAGSIYTLPVKLTVGSAGTTAVEVSAAALTLDTTTATLTDTIAETAVQDIP
ncbi:MAG: carboxypeptidase-like regulatory domain-containing protein, partial [Terriglobales bacterium]